MTIRVSFLPEARAELGALHDPVMQRECLTLLSRAGRHVFGLPLGPNPQTGDLTGCRKIYFARATMRIVLRYVPDEITPIRVDVIAIGPRESMEVYATAVRRLLGS